MRILLLGESWHIHLIHQKGFDSFTNSEYVEGGAEFKEALTQQGWDVVHIPAHRIADDMPQTVEGLSAYDCVVVSDVGANTFLLTPGVFKTSVPEVNRLEVLAEYVRQGGAMLMVGGYLSFSGIDGKAHYARSPLAPILPVELLVGDDRMEAPQGVKPVVLREHPAIPTDTDWPALLGYNATIAKPDAEVVVTVEDAPLVAVANVGQGRAGVFTSDLAPHWAPPTFLAWDGYAQLWHNLLTWLSNSD
ncbi:glutamine amidotransferase [Pedococcus sp. NPDC057267]|uniref:glutamine amidotransferase n=1 Tax=Pedococcus sp. NPDC057267 TaxID=3346077 RepID=UPI003644FBCB